MIRMALKQVDFGLQDSFCDSNDLNDSWDQTRMPECLIEFFTSLLNMRKSDLIGSNRNSLVDDIDTEDHENDEMNNDSKDEDHSLNEEKTPVFQELLQEKRKRSQRFV